MSSYLRIRIRVDDTVTMLRARGSRVRIPEGARNFSLVYKVQISSGAHSASYLMGTRNRGSFPGIKRRKRKVYHSPVSSAEVKKEWSYTSACFRGVDRKNFPFYFKFSSINWYEMWLHVSAKISHYQVNSREFCSWKHTEAFKKLKLFISKL